MLVWKITYVIVGLHVQAWNNLGTTFRVNFEYMQLHAATHLQVRCDCLENAFHFEF